MGGGGREEGGARVREQARTECERVREDFLFIAHVPGEEEGLFESTLSANDFFLQCIDRRSKDAGTYIHKYMSYKLYTMWVVRGCITR